MEVVSPSLPHGRPFPDRSPLALFDQKLSGPSVSNGRLLTEQRRATHLWTTDDDNLLKTMVDRYPENWGLIAECFNSSKLTISNDKRTAKECQERWKDQWAPPDSLKRPADNLFTPGIEATPPPTAASTQMTTRGVKRNASTSVSAASSGTPMASEPKRRRRHVMIQETIRKAAKKKMELNSKLSGMLPNTSVIYV